MCQLPRGGPMDYANLSSLGTRSRKEPAGGVTGGPDLGGHFPLDVLQILLDWKVLDNTLKLYFPFSARSAGTACI